MLVLRTFCFAFLLWSSAIGILFADQPNDATQRAEVVEDGAKSRADTTGEELKRCTGKLLQLVESQDVARLEKKMTRVGQQEFSVEAVMIVADIVSWGQNDLDAKTFGKISDVHKQFEIGKLKVDYGDDIRTEAEMNRFDEELFESLGSDDRRIEMVTAILKATSEAELDLNPFVGNVVSVAVDGENAKVGLRVELDSDVEADDQQADPDGDDRAVINEFPDVILKFARNNGEWLWNGVDYDAMFEADVARDKIFVKDLELSGESADGKEVDLKDYRGKFVLVDFWGTWCSPCVAELPGLKKIHEAVKDKGFEVLGVAVDDQESISAFLKKSPLPWVNIVDGESEICERLRINAFPTTLLIDRDGENVARNVSGVELLDELVKRMDLDGDDFADLRKKLANHNGDGGGEEKRPVGFESADANQDDKVTSKELKTYLIDRLGDEDLPHGKIFQRLDADENGSLSRVEFDDRHKVIMYFMGDDYFGSNSMPDPKDPGRDYVLFRGADQPVDDRAVMGAVFHRTREAAAREPAFEVVELKRVPKSLPVSQKPNPELKGKPSVARLAHATITLAGGGRDFFTAGAVVVSHDGLAVTNFHVAEALADYPLVGLTSDGKPHRVVEFLAGNRDRDVALIRLKGEGFQPVKIAEATPKMGDDIVMMHHSESRFFTYDRGYVMRYPTVGKHPWMQISADYAPGGSGCGIYNEKHELIGLVSTVLYGDGPSLAEEFDEQPGEPVREEVSEMEEGDEMVPSEYGMLLVKHAVPLSAIKTLWSKDETDENSSR